MFHSWTELLLSLQKLETRNFQIRNSTWRRSTTSSLIERVISCEINISVTRYTHGEGAIVRVIGESYSITLVRRCYSRCELKWARGLNLFTDVDFSRPSFAGKTTTGEGRFEAFFEGAARGSILIIRDYGLKKHRLTLWEKISPSREGEDGGGEEEK